MPTIQLCHTRNSLIWGNVINSRSLPVFKHFHSPAAAVLLVASPKEIVLVDGFWEVAAFVLVVAAVMLPVAKRRNERHLVPFKPLISPSLRFGLAVAANVVHKPIKRLMVRYAILFATPYARPTHCGIDSLTRQHVCHCHLLWLWQWQWQWQRF